jgi:hypothetical protein
MDLPQTLKIAFWLSVPVIASTSWAGIINRYGPEFVPQKRNFLAGSAFMGACGRPASGASATLRRRIQVDEPAH